MRAYSGGLGQPFDLIALETPALLDRTGPSVGSWRGPTAPDRDWNASLSMGSKAIGGLPPRQNPGEITGTSAIRRGQHGLDGRRSREKGETVHQRYSDSSQGCVHAVFSLPSRMSPDRSLRGESLEMLRTVRRAGRRPRSQLQQEDSEGLRAQKTGVIFDELDDLLARISTLAQTQTSTARGSG